MIWLLFACGAGALVERADGALARGDLPAAEAGYREALRRDPSRAEALYGLGWTYHLAGQRDAARDAFTQLTRMHPDSALGFKGLGSVAMKEGNAPLAREQFKAALERAPGDRKIRQSLALLELSGGNATAALTTFDALIAEEAGRPEFHQGRAEALVALGRGEEAVSAADRARELASDPRTRAATTLTRVRAILAASAGRVDARDCAGTAGAVLQWLDAADLGLDEVEASGVPIEESKALRREVRRRRGNVEDLCPAVARDG